MKQRYKVTLTVDGYVASTGNALSAITKAKRIIKRALREAGMQGLQLTEASASVLVLDLSKPARKK